MVLHRRGFVGGLLVLSVPAIVRTPGLLMPISAFVRPLQIVDTGDYLTGLYLEKFRTEMALIMGVPRRYLFAEL